MLKKKTFHTAAVLPAIAFGATISLTAEVAADGHSPIVVTATRTAQTADETIAPVTVITRQDIENSTSRSVPDLIRATAGVDLSTNGPYGKTSGVFLRGTATDHVLVLIDGVKLYSATLGTTQIELLPLEQIDRIEILRGPRASLYGAEALGGVIQIFTRDGGKDNVIDLGIGAGSDSTKEASVGFSGGSGDSRFSIRASGFDTDGVDVLDGAQLDEDGFDRASLQLSFDHDISNTANIGLNVLRSSGSNEYDNAFDTPDADNRTEYTQQVIALKGGFSFSDNWASSVQLSRSSDETEDFRNDIFSNMFETDRTALSWQNDHQIGDAALFTWGIDYSDDKVDSSTNYDEASRDNVGLYAQYQRDMGDHGIVVALRSDDNEQFGSFTTGNVDYRYALNKNLRLTAGLGRAFKAPSFNELYFPGFGNAALEVEESESFEIGLQGDHANGSFGVRLFKTEIDNLIGFDLATFLPANIDSASIKGLEASYSTSVAGWGVRAALTLLDPEDESTGKTLRRRAKTSLRVDANRNFGNWDLGGSLIYQGRRYEDSANTQPMDSYAIVNLQGKYRFNDNLSLTATAENLFDKEYETAIGYKEKGRSFYLRLKYNMPLK